MPHPSWLTSGNVLRHLPHAIVALLACVALGNLAGSEWGLLKKLVHFPAFWAPLALMLALGFAWVRQWGWMLASMALCLGFGAQVALLWQPPQDVVSTTGSSAAASPPRTVIAFNVFQNNGKHAEVLAALQAEQADVVFLTEMSRKWFTALAPLEKDYPYRLGKPGHSDWLLSKHPLEDARLVSLTFESAQAANASTASGLPGEPLAEQYRKKWSPDDLLIATILMDGKRVRLGGLHPPTPKTPTSVAQQRACAMLYRQELDTDPKAHAQLLVGDFNTSSFSPTFRLLLRATGLRDTVRGFGYAPTWGPRMPREPWLPWLGIPIDHVLASTNVRTLSHEVGPPLGSDHRWVKVRFIVE